jgi:hypothetical protein
MAISADRPRSTPQPMAAPLASATAALTGPHPASLRFAAALSKAHAQGAVPADAGPWEPSPWPLDPPGVASAGTAAGDGNMPDSTGAPAQDERSGRCGQAVSDDRQNRPLLKPEKPAEDEHRRLSSLLQALTRSVAVFSGVHGDHWAVAMALREDVLPQTFVRLEGRPQHLRVDLSSESSAVVDLLQRHAVRLSHGLQRRCGCEAEVRIQLGTDMPSWDDAPDA